MKFLTAYLLLGFALFFAHGQTSNAKIQTFSFHDGKVMINRDSCSERLPDSFYRYKGIEISTYFQVVGSIKLTAIKGAEILVLSPLNKEEFEYKLPCYISPGKILLVYNDSIPNAPVQYITDKVLQNEWYLGQIPSNTLSATAKGFDVLVNTGGLVKCDLSMHFVAHGKKIFLGAYETSFYGGKRPSSFQDRIYHLKPLPKNELNKVESFKLIRWPSWYN